jgi:hypothetical protein
MRHGKLFDRDFTLLQSTTNLIFIGTFQPQLDRFFDHCFRVFRGNKARFGETPKPTGGTPVLPGKIALSDSSCPT